MKVSKKCFICKKEYFKKPTVSKKEWCNSMFCSRVCRGVYQSKYLVKEKSPFGNYKGGTVSKKGYRYISISGKRVLEHRYIVEQFFKIKLSKRQQVHHINHNKLDNRIENLMIMDICEHSKEHNPKGSYFGKNKKFVK